MPLRLNYKPPYQIYRRHVGGVEPIKGVFEPLGVFISRAVIKPDRKHRKDTEALNGKMNFVVHQGENELLTLKGDDEEHNERGGLEDPTEFDVTEEIKSDYDGDSHRAVVNEADGADDEEEQYF